VLADEHIGPLVMASESLGEMLAPAEFEAFYLSTSRALHGYLSRLSRDPGTAEEVLQEAYIRIINARAMDEGQRKAYLYAIATNLLRDLWRKQKREKQWLELTPEAERPVSNPNLRLDMAEIFDNLSPQERAVLWLAHVEELSHREISVILRIKEKSVRVVVHRAREKAKDLLRRAGLERHS